MVDITTALKDDVGLEVMAHLSCVGETAEGLDSTLDRLRDAGIDNILALRGDPPQGQEDFVQPEGKRNEALGIIRQGLEDVSVSRTSITWGVPVPWEWTYFPDKIPAFSDDLVALVCRLAGTEGILGNCHASGTTIIAQLGDEHIKTGKPIFYTSADSVFQIACHEGSFGLDNLYKFPEDFKFNVHSQGRVSSSDLDLIKFSEIIYKNESLKNQVVDLLCKFDTGISDIEFEEITILNNNNEEKKQVNMAVGVHKYKDKDMKFIFLDESNGTRSALLLMGEILPVLNNGGVAIIDELDNDLHPHLLPILLDLFKHKHSNPYDAQIIFSCHTPEVLNLLYKHQIYMVQKNNQESESWRLDQVIGLRVDDNIYSKYMSGALDAVPNV